MPCEIFPSGTLPLLRPQLVGHRLIEFSDSRFWAEIYMMEISSEECLTKVRSLLTCKSNIDVTRSFQGEEAQAFIDFLDRVSKLRCGVSVPQPLRILNTGSGAIGP